MREAARHLAPGLRALGRDDFGNVVEHQQPRIARQLGAARHDVDGVVLLRQVVAGGVQFEGVLPVIEAVLHALDQELVELLLHLGTEIGQPRHIDQRLAFIGGERRAQHAGGARVGGQHGALGVEHDHARGQVVQDGLQVAAGGVELVHGLLDRAARVGQLLGHDGERAREAAQLVLALQHGGGPQVAGGHLAHAVGQHEQRPCELVAEQHGQQHRAEHGEEQAQRERADVHAPQPLAREGPLLVLAVGFLHG
ncbi:hypothetical protein FQZ97_753240 [compost metagenome]